MAVDGAPMTPYHLLRPGQLLVHNPPTESRNVYEVKAVNEGGRKCDLDLMPYSHFKYPGTPMGPGYWCKSKRHYGWRILSDKEEAYYRLTGHL